MKHKNKKRKKIENQSWHSTEFITGTTGKVQVSAGVQDDFSCDPCPVSDLLISG